MKVTLLGTGTSQGVPVIGCRCDVCRSDDAHDRRLRTSAMVEVGGVRLIIDAGPDFRCQMLRAGVERIDAILLTHHHRDHIGGLDDVRAFNFVDYPPVIHTIDIYAAGHTVPAVRKEFDYAFVEGEARYRGVPEIAMHEVDEQRPFTVGGVEIIPVAGRHSERLRVTGYRIGPVAYMTDFKSIDPQEEAKLAGVDTLIVNALRHKPHPSHYSVGEALALIGRVAPRAAYLTHMSHEVGLHAAFDASLPDGVHAGYDGLEIEISE